MIKRIKYNYHIIDISPYPLYTALSIFTIMISSILIINKYNIEYITPQNINLIGILLLSINIYLWWKDIIKEGLYKGEHNNKVENNLNVGFILFVISEILIFASFFFSYFYNSFIPDIIISSFWPPKGIIPINSYSISIIKYSFIILFRFYYNSRTIFNKY